MIARAVRLLLATMAPLALLWQAPARAAFDHQYWAWSALLHEHVVLQDEGISSRVSNAGFARDRAELKASLDALSGVGEYGKDFARDWKGIETLDQWLAKYADVLADKPEDRVAIRAGGLPVTFLDYDWRLNDAK